MNRILSRRPYVIPFFCYFSQHLIGKVSTFSVHHHTAQTLNKPISQTFGIRPFLSTSNNSFPSKSSSLAAKKSSEMDESIISVPKKYIPTWMKQERTRVLTTPTTPKDRGKCVLYWMQRDVRTEDNWALLFAMHMAKECQVPLRVAHILPSPEEQAERLTERHTSFLLGGLKSVHEELNAVNVPLEVLCLPSSDSTSTGEAFYKYATNKKNDAKAVICDFNPLRLYRNWMEQEAAPLFSSKSIPLYQVDAHNIVPVWVASGKREVGARTLRPKINKRLPEFMTHFPKLENNNTDIQTDDLVKDNSIDWDDCHKYVDPDDSVPPVQWAQPGAKSAMKQFEFFQKNGLKDFDTLRNDPNQRNICSNLSPWINHGHISFQRLALEVRGAKKYPNGTAAYIEEGVVRRELSDNYVYYTPDNYDSLTAAAQWAQDSLELHSTDEREYLYSKKEFETGLTHDDLWNAAQIQLVKEGKMHGFVSYFLH